jgi:hypothetical protein
LNVIKDYSEQLPVFNEEVWLSAHLLKINWLSFLRAFPYLQKAPLGTVMSVRLSLCIYQRGFHWTDFREILYWEIIKQTLNLVQPGPKYRSVYITTQVGFIVFGDINKP